MTPSFPAALMAVAGSAAALIFLGWVARQVRRWLKRLDAQPLVADLFWSDRPYEPGWTEALGGRGRHRYVRAFSVDDHLMEVDAMARRGEIGAGYGG